MDRNRRFWLVYMCKACLGKWNQLVNNSLWWNKTMQAHFCWCGIKNGVRKWLKRNSTTWSASPPCKFVYEVHNQQVAMQWIALKEAIWKDATLFNFNLIFLEGCYCVCFGVVFCSSIKMFMFKAVTYVCFLVGFAYCRLILILHGCCRW
jgi:hypothetical protein